MKNTLGLAVAALAPATTASFAGETLDRVMAAGKLVTSTDPEYPPQSSLDANNDFIGFDIEVGREIAKRLGVEIEFVVPEWDVITAGNWAARWDVSVGSMTPTPAQAIRIIIPPTGNQFIAMLKDSSLVSVLGAWDLMYIARTHGKSEFKYTEMLITAALIYWIMSMVFEALQARLERYYGRSDMR